LAIGGISQSYRGPEITHELAYTQDEEWQARLYKSHGTRLMGNRVGVGSYPILP